MPTASVARRQGVAAPPPVSLDTDEHQRDIINRLRRIEGQARGLADMIRNERSCEEVALQMSAMRKAMDKAFYRLMACSVLEAVRDAGDDPTVTAEVEQATRLLERFG